MEQKYKNGDSVVIFENGRKVVGKVLGIKGKGIFRMYAVGFECKDAVMEISYKTYEFYREYELHDLSSVQETESKGIVSNNVLMDILYMKYPKERVDKLITTDYMKTKIRNMLIGLITILFSIAVVPYSIKAGSTWESICMIILSVVGITTGITLNVCEWKCLKKRLENEEQSNKGELA